MTTFAVQRLHSPLEWNGSGTRRLKESKFSDSEKSIYACNTCVMLVKKSTVTFFLWNIKFYSLQNIRCCLFQEMKKGHILRILSVFLFALVFLFLLRSSENEVLKCSSECDKTAITLRSMFENFGYDDASFKKESFFFLIWRCDRDVKADGLITWKSHRNASWSNKEKFNASLTKYAIV